MESINLIFSGVGVVAVLPVLSGAGVMLANFAAVVLGKPAAQRSEWTALGAAVGCVCGFFAMLAAIATENL
jgi:uncharacterized protein YqgC (DUF456 family)